MASVYSSRSRRLAGGALVILASCTHKIAVSTEPTWVPSPSGADVGLACADVHDARVCWAEGRTQRIERPTPDSHDPWRCVGEHAERKCRRRRGTTGAFVCNEASCVQDMPRYPDDGEWECFEREGAVVCRGGEPAAAVVADRRDAGWACGDVPRAAKHTRVCIDVSPDRPPDPAFSACAYRETRGRVRQICERREEPRLGARCNDGSVCPLGAACVGGVCVPARAPQPNCWFDSDCAAGESCAFAMCVAAR